MQEIHISPMETGDIPACVKLMLDNPLWQHYNITSGMAERMFTSALEECATILVSRMGDQTVGFVWYSTTGSWDRSGYIRLIGISPEFHGQGIGERLMLEAERRMGEKVGEVFLLVTDFNLGAQRFYRRLGYDQIGEIPDYVIPGTAELIFYKRLRRGEW